MITDKAVNKYLEDNGVIVTWDTAKYYRLGRDRIKDWYVDNVPEPSLSDLATYEQEVADEQKQEKLFKLKRAAKIALQEKELEQKLETARTDFEADPNTDLPEETKEYFRKEKDPSSIKLATQAAPATPFSDKFKAG